MYVLVGTCWIAGTVYLDSPPRTRPLGDLELAGEPHVRSKVEAMR